MNYIVLDLEWNQSSTKADEKEIPFEIIEIGAVKLDENRQIVSEFQKLVKPQIYHKMHQYTGELVHLKMRELRKGDPFPVAMQQFLKWCGSDYQFVTWGPLDLTELQRNMQYYQLAPLSNGPFSFYDAQKLFYLHYEDNSDHIKTMRSLEYAIDYLNIEKDIPFHRALSDAYYTARVLQTFTNTDVFQNVSYDTFHVPSTRAQEIHHTFATYQKYISRAFEDKATAMADHEVQSSKCYLCHKNLRKKIKWFTNNGKNYFCVASCDVHGYIKYKARIRPTSSGEVYVVKTSRIISSNELDEIRAKRKKNN